MQGHSLLMGDVNAELPIKIVTFLMLRYNFMYFFYT